MDKTAVPFAGLEKAPPFFDLIFEQFGSLSEAVVDASSLIYMQKAGFLENLARVLALYAPEEIIRETGFSDLPVQSVMSRDADVSNDEKLLASAVNRRWPVISEDRKILVRARQKGLAFFNALMMLHFLLFRKAINLQRHASCGQKLKEYAWYGGPVLGIADAVYHRIRKGTPSKKETVTDRTFKCNYQR